MTATLHVLAIGLHRPLRIAACAYILGRQCELTEAIHLHDLDWLQMRGECDIAVLGDRLSKTELTEAAQLVRRRWSHAVILLVCAEAEVIEDVLYEFHLPFGSTEGMLVAGICSLAGYRQRGQDRPWEYGSFPPPKRSS
jgi:hypothetical protein